MQKETIMSVALQEAMTQSPEFRIRFLDSELRLWKRKIAEDTTAEVRALRRETARIIHEMCYNQAKAFGLRGRPKQGPSPGLDAMDDAYKVRMRERIAESERLQHEAEVRRNEEIERFIERYQDQCRIQRDALEKRLEEREGDFAAEQLLKRDFLSPESFMGWERGWRHGTEKIIEAFEKTMTIQEGRHQRDLTALASSGKFFNAKNCYDRATAEMTKVFTQRREHAVSAQTVQALFSPEVMAQKKAKLRDRIRKKIDACDYQCAQLWEKGNLLLEERTAVVYKEIASLRKLLTSVSL